MCKLRDDVKEGKAHKFTLDEEGVLWFENYLCVPDVKFVRREVLEEAHKSAYAIHPNATKT